MNSTVPIDRFSFQHIVAIFLSGVYDFKIFIIMKCGSFDHILKSKSQNTNFIHRNWNSSETIICTLHACTFSLERHIVYFINRYAGQIIYITLYTYYIYNHLSYEFIIKKIYTMVLRYINIWFIVLWKLNVVLGYLNAL